MPYQIIQFPVTGGGSSGPAAGNGFITPVFSTTARNIGLPNPYQIVDVGAVLADSATLNRANSQADKQLTVAAYDSTIPVAYGRVRVPALLANAVVYGGYWHFWCLWCRGLIQAVDTVYVNDLTPGSGFVQHALGSDTQGIIGSLFLPMNAWYFSTFGVHRTFDQKFPNVAGSDVVVAVADVQQPPQINAIIRALKLYDPRDPHAILGTPSTYTFSSNAALALADFLRSGVYGAGVPVDDVSLETAANAADAEGWTVNLLISQKQKIADVVSQLQQAANCRIVRTGNAIRLVPDALSSSVATFDHGGGQVMGVTQEQGASQADLPTVVEVVYTDASAVPWKDASVSIQRDGVADGSTPWRKASLRMPWIVDTGDGMGRAEALKQCYLYMNKAWLRQPRFALDVLDEGLYPTEGDAFTLLYPDSAYPSGVRVKADTTQPTKNGWQFGVFYDDPGAYADDHIADPTPPTDLPDPFDVPAVKSLTGREDPEHPRVIAEWLPPDNYPYVKDYPFTVNELGVSPSLVYSSFAPNRPVIARPDPSLETGDVPADQDYLVTVWVRNVFGMLGPPTSIIVHVSSLTYTAFSYAFQVANLVNMIQVFDVATGSYYWETDFGQLWDATFPNLLDTYTNVLDTYHAPGTSTLTTEEADSGQTFDATASWTGETTTIPLSGVPSQYIELRVGASDPWVRHAAPSVSGVSARRARFSSETTGTDTQRVNALGEVAVILSR